MRELSVAEPFGRPPERGLRKRPSADGRKG